MSHSDASAIHDFVRDQLGCQCPAEVFEHIEHTANHPVSPARPYTVRVVIGDRLLIYCVTAPQLAAADLSIAEVLEAGRAERDTHKYNRFRAVLVDDQATNPALAAAESAPWKTQLAADDRLHLHIVPPDNVPPVLLPPAG